MAVAALKTLIISGLMVGLVAGCEPGNGGSEITTEPLADPSMAADPNAPEADPSTSDPAQGATGVIPAKSVKLVDRDVEAPEDFQTTDKALWDGRPSIGGVWVAATNVSDPMRVIMRNPANGKFVIGALFRREAENPGPKLQISSDAADALGLIAGEPATISVTALRREEVAAPIPDATKPLLDTSETVAAADVAAATTTAIAATAEKPAIRPASKPVAGASEPVTTETQPAASGASIQIGIFSVEKNAKSAVALLAKAGITATIRKETSAGKPSWSVITNGDAAILDKIKKAGFADAYFL